MSEKKSKQLGFLPQTGLRFAQWVGYVVSSGFFRRVKVIGRHNIPQDEPTIICSNHSNQFMDAINLLAHIATPQKPIKFLIAGKSYRRPVIGHFSKLLQSIPVERAQDFAKTGKGKIISLTKDRIRGKDTKFTEEIKIKESFSIHGFDEPIVVKQIISDEECIIYDTHYSLNDQHLAYKIQPKIDQSSIYNAVSDSLNNNDIIGIFPEGGSTDRTDLLPLKAGVCIMALEAMIKYNKPVNIVCCGINYFKAHKFRSRVIMDIGVPYRIPIEFIDKYKASRRDAIAELLGIITQDMRNVIYPAPSYDELTCILQARKIYTPEGRLLKSQEELELNKRFSKGYNKLKDSPEVKQMVKAIGAYRQGLKFLGISDRELRKIKKNIFSDTYYMIKSLVIFLICFSFALPGVILNYPVGYVLSTLAETEREKCLKASKVKVKGNDVVASYIIKLGIVALPLYHCFFSTMLFFVLKNFTELKGYKPLLYAFLFFVLYPLYSFRMLKASDKFVRCLKQMRARMVLVFSYNAVKTLREKRRQLKEKIEEYVDNNFFEVCGDEAERIIGSKSDIKLKSNPKQDKIDDTLDEQSLQEAFSYLKELGI